jgi:hypothetical protein
LPVVFAFFVIGSAYADAAADQQMVQKWQAQVQTNDQNFQQYQTDYMQFLHDRRMTNLDASCREIQVLIEKQLGIMKTAPGTSEKFDDAVTEYLRLKKILDARISSLSKEAQKQ